MDGDNTFSNRTSANSGLDSERTTGAHVSGGNIYVSPHCGSLSISTDVGATFTNRTSSNRGLGSDLMYGIYINDTSIDPPNKR